MTEDNSTLKAPRNKPAKPYPDYPLFAHAVGYWAKKIRGKLVYFGPWDDPDAALKKYLEQKDDLHAGRTPRPDPHALAVKDVANLFLQHRQEMVDAGELSPKTWADYKSIMDLLVEGLGKHALAAHLTPADFAALRHKLAKRNGPYRLGTIIQVIRCAFKHAYDSEMMERPTRFGPGFKRPSKKTLRLHRAKQGLKLFTAEEIHKLLDAAGTTMKAMILLGLNCGYGNSDCGKLKIDNLDLEGGWVNFPRPKTGIDRRCPLWPQTVQAIKEALAERPEPKDKTDARLVFVTKYGAGWDKDQYASPITHEMRKVMDTAGINGHQNFYCLRHNLETIGGEARDQVALNAIMGHVDDSMAAHYRERIGDDRLKAIADHIRRWLFPAVESAAVIPFAKATAK